jgi:hypothetical protein
MSDVLRILGAAVVRPRSWGVATFLAFGLLLSACGQKGPLFLPPPPATAPQTTR